MAEPPVRALKRQLVQLLLTHDWCQLVLLRFLHSRLPGDAAGRLEFAADGVCEAAQCIVLASTAWDNTGACISAAGRQTKSG